MEDNITQLTQQAIIIAESAGNAIMEFYEHGRFEQFSKDDASPVTSADYAANDVVLTALQNITPNIPIMSEESEGLALRDRQGWSRYWLIDPLDGTQEFVAGRPDFAVNIALIDEGKPVIGVVHVPATKVTFWGCRGQGSYKRVDGRDQRLKANSLEPNQKQLKVAISRVQTLNTITQYINPDISLEFISLGSCALKSCLVAEGQADIYIRIGPTGEWDTGAPQVIVEEAGGSIIDSEFSALTYNQRESFLNPNFIVNGDADFDWSSVIIPHKSRRDC